MDGDPVVFHDLKSRQELKRHLSAYIILVIADEKTVENVLFIFLTTFPIHLAFKPANIPYFYKKLYIIMCV